ncbi:hypothetical protein F4802DRAFT_18244 [Xylaria palmicola]|nr:hypothetical protein F4802DRAFT_18244 [Xylaria palmicola]
MPSSGLLIGVYLACFVSLSVQLAAVGFPPSLPLSSKDATTNSLPLAARETVTLTFAQPQGTLMVSTPGAGKSSTSFQTSTMVRATNTSLAIFAFSLTAATYGILIKYSLQLSNQVAIPVKFLRENVNRVLERLLSQHGGDGRLLAIGTGASYDLYAEGVSGDPAWEEFETGSTWKKLNHPARRLIDAGSLPTWDLPLFADLIDGSRYLHDQRVLEVPAGSPAMKLIVQASIWEWVALWLAAVALVNTLTYNGFATGDNTPDMALRLFVVSVYAIAVFGHMIYVMKTNIFPTLSCFVFQTTWGLLTRHFAVKSGYFSHALYFEGVVMGQTKVKGHLERMAVKRGVKVVAVDRELPPRVISTFLDCGNPIPADQLYKDMGAMESTLEENLKPILESEIKVLEKAAEATLERTMANVAILLGICLVTGLSPWTSTKSTDATSAQLGSYALLISASTGILALTSSLSHFSTTADSARRLLKLNELVLSSDRPSHQRGDNEFNDAEFGFSADFGHNIDGYLVTTTRLWNLIKRENFPWSVFLGPVLCFLQTRSPIHASAIELRVRGTKLE